MTPLDPAALRYDERGLDDCDCDAEVLAAGAGFLGIARPGLASSEVDTKTYA